MTLDLRDKRIVVTGGAGFLGQHVVRKLLERGCSPERIVVPRSREIDLTDRAATERLFEQAKPEVVFHLAAQVGGIGANRKSPGRFFYANMAMGLHVVDAARRFGVEKLVVTGTICAYPKHCPIPFREDDLWAGYPEETNAPYGVAKKAILVMAQAYRQEYGLRSIVLFPVNLYGPEDNFDLESSHVIPALIRKLIEARDRGAGQVVLWGDGSPTREFLYVDDCAEGLVLGAERYDEPDPVNLGAGFEISIRDLATKLAELTGFRGELVWDTTQPNGQPRRMLDVTRARERFGFVARTSLDDGLRRTLDWYETHRARSEGRA
ncbi:MAG: GDP-L-fucose synthase [Deltaproteobacteria bacterium]|nr:GDP-L-fucose synthase [Deltaproteobacteria bacterium]